jgi:arylsulfatase A-like enzyme
VVPVAGRGQPLHRPALHPDEGYHLSKDLADKAISFIQDVRQTEVGKPWYLWFCPGANHAPHHAPKDYIDKYKGMFDDGYEAYREWVLPRMIERGILPEGTDGVAVGGADVGGGHDGPLLALSTR